MSRFPALFYQLQQPEQISSILSREIPLQFPNICKFEAKELIDFGAVYVDGKRCLQDLDLKPLQNLKAHLVPKRFPKISELSIDQIIFEDEFLVVINKPYGVPIHATRDNLYENALEKMKKELATKLYVTHRLDTETRGLSIFAKSPESQRQINALFSSGQVEKFYQVGTSLELPLGPMIHWTSFETTIPRIFSLTQESPDWKDCHLEVLATSPSADGGFRSRVQLHTGRTHQIRGQMALIGNPVIGDSIYNPDCHHKAHEMQLFCEQMNFKLNGKAYLLKLN